MNYKPGRIFLSAPHMGGHEKNYVQKAIEDNWVSTTGPNIIGFEHDISQHTNARHVVALNTGTAALHLALQLAGVKSGDNVICATFTSVASVNPVFYLGAKPVLVDCEPDTWNMCPELLEEAIKEQLKRGKKPAAILLVHVYGMPAKIKEIMAIAEQYEIPVVENASEALGSRYCGHHVGTFGKIGTFSFNGDKIITTSGGGALIATDENIIKQALHLANQANDDGYAHSQVGYNYRMSNISAGIGRGQIEVLETRVKQRRDIFNYYRNQLKQVEGITFLPEPKECFSNRWLTTLLLPESITPEAVSQSLEEHNIETRPLWKPMHQQPLFKDCTYFGQGISDRIYAKGICLPSSSFLSEDDQLEVIKQLKQLFPE
jgi:dTDP-4-amino-4,6-dideoxygalactose transaminase